LRLLASTDTIELAITDRLVLDPGATGEIFRGVLSGRAALGPGAALALSESVSFSTDFILSAAPGSLVTFNYYIDTPIVPATLEIANASTGTPASFRVVEGSGLNCEDWKAAFVDPAAVYEPVCGSERDRTFLLAKVVGENSGGEKGTPGGVDRKPLIYGLVGAAAAVLIIIVVVVILKSRGKGSKVEELEMEEIVEERAAPEIHQEEEESDETFSEQVEVDPEDQAVFYDLGPDVCPFGSCQSVGRSNRDRFVNNKH
jgi:hypothetical protein